MVNKFLKAYILHRSSSDTCINTVTTLEEMEFKTLVLHANGEPLLNPHILLQFCKDSVGCLVCQWRRYSGSYQGKK